jgi:predicted GNAT family acetyltransferase
MEISVLDDRQASRFELHVDGEVLGYLTYQRAGDVVSFLEVTTDLSRAGEGLGLLLVRRALDAVAAEGLWVLPVCPFVRDFIQRHPVYLDMVPAEDRQRFELH